MPSTQPNPPSITLLLETWQQGHRGALDELMPRVYEALLQQAQLLMGRERRGHTLEPANLVNETYLRLLDQQQVHWQNRAQFFAVASRLMRRILVDYARKNRAAKRGHGQKVTLIPEDGAVHEVDVFFLDEALAALAHEDPVQVQIVELRFFGGLTIKEVAQVMEMGVTKVKQEWLLAKMWLLKTLSDPRA